MNVEFDGLLRIMLIGDCNVGKTALLKRFSDDTFDPMYRATISVASKCPTIDVDRKIIQLNIEDWDTFDMDLYKLIAIMQSPNMHGFIIVYDVTCRQSFDSLKEWFQLINENANDRVGKTLVGTKCDLNEKRVVEYAEGKTLADSLGISFFETTARDSTNVEKVFMQLASQIISDPPQMVEKTPNLIDRIHRREPVHVGCWGRQQSVRDVLLRR